jgi:hypothetical protein
LTKSSTPRVVAVLGMHRSGTSWLAGSLQELGLEMGEVSTADPHNKKGNRESPVLMEIHEGVLADNDGSWKKPPKKAAWSQARSTALAAHVADMNARYPSGWGFKDPRALLVFDEWLRQVPRLDRVGIFRHPLAVHRSLAARSDRFDEARSTELWRAYNERLIAEHDRAPFTVLRFDVAPDALFAGLQRVAKELSLPAADRRSAFFDAELVHNNDVAAEPIPRACRKLWTELEARASA